MREKMIFFKLTKVIINPKRSSLDVDLALRLTDNRLDGGAHFQACEWDGDGGAVIDDSMFSKRINFPQAVAVFAGMVHLNI